MNRARPRNLWKPKVLPDADVGELPAATHRSQFPRPRMQEIGRSADAPLPDDALVDEEDLIPFDEPSPVAFAFVLGMAVASLIWTTVVVVVALS